MLVITLRGQLGNQMFQYAAVRSLAQERGYAFAHRPTPVSLREHARRALGRPWLYFPCVLRKYFELPGDYRLINGLRQAWWKLRPKHGREPFSDRRREAAPGLWIAAFDDKFADLPDNSEVKAWLQSELYFRQHRPDILRWFTPRRKYRAALEKLERTLPGNAEQRCCIHIRRADYINSADGMGSWALPLDYYRAATAALPPDLRYHVISDDPDWAEEHITWLKNLTISRDQAAVVDMFLLARCRYSIIANSTFSWWGAWLNDRADKVVIAPKYFVGWRRKVWYPQDIAVEGWRFMDCGDNSSGF